MGADADTLDLLHRALQLTVTPVVVTAPPAPLVEVAVDEYDGATDKDGVFEGYGTALFRLGNRYQGQWAGGKMHGQGTYQWSDGIMYSGDFSYNKCTGKGKMTWPDGSEYEGDMVNGTRHGFGSLLVPGPSGQTITYTGQWNQGVRHGTGKITYDDAESRWYEGSWKDDLREGHGEMHYASGAHYKGEWVANVKCGFGTMVWANERESYYGQWRDDKPHGEGTYLWQVLLPGTAEAAKMQATQSGRPSVSAAAAQGDLSIVELAPQMHGINRYVGQFEKGLRQGHGTFYYADGARYEGQWVANQKHGMGRFIYEDGSVYEGPFDRDRPVKPTQAASTHGLVRLTCEDLLADESEPEEVSRALSNLLLREASALREIYRAAADPPSAQAVEWTLRPEVFGKLLRHAGALSPFLPLSEALAVAEPAFDGDGKILFRQFLNALIRVANVLYRNFPRLDERFSAFLERNMLPVLRGDGMDEIAEAVDGDADVHNVFSQMAHIVQDIFPTKPEGTTVRHIVARLKALDVIGEPSVADAAAEAPEAAGGEGEEQAEGAEGQGAEGEGAAAAAAEAAAAPPEPEAPPANPPEDAGAEGRPAGDGEGGEGGWTTAEEGEQQPMEGAAPPSSEHSSQHITYPRKLTLDEAVQVVMAACYGGQAKDSLEWAQHQEPQAAPPVNHFMLSGTVEPLQIYEIVARVASATQNPGHPLAARIHIFLQSVANFGKNLQLPNEESSAPAVVPAMLEQQLGAEAKDGDATNGDQSVAGGKAMLTSWPTGPGD